MVLCTLIRTEHQTLLCFSATGPCAPVQEIPCLAILPPTARTELPPSVVPTATLPPPSPSTIGKRQDPRCVLVLVSAATRRMVDPVKVVVVIGSQVSRAIKVILTSPSGKVQSQNTSNWQQMVWSPPGHLLSSQGPLEWTLPLTPEACLPLQNLKFKLLHTVSFLPDPEPGNYSLSFPTFPHAVLKIDPLIKDPQELSQLVPDVAGSQVVKMDLQEMVLIRPQMSLKEIRVNLAALNTTLRLPQCAPFLSASTQGWETWLHMWESPSSPADRVRRDLSSAVAPMAAGASMLNAMDIEVLANKFSHATQVIAKLGKPATEALNSISEVQHQISSILVDWEVQVERDFLLFMEGVRSLQASTALALACAQAQSLNMAVVMGMIRQATEGHLPLEIRNLIMPKMSPIEIQLEKWWVLVNASFSPSLQELRLFLLTASAATFFPIHPIISLGIQVAPGEVLYAETATHWAKREGDAWVPFDARRCSHRDQLGFLCDDQDFSPPPPCLFPSTGSRHDCRYEWSRENGSALTYIGHGCVCIRTQCEYVLLDSFTVHPMVPQINRCFCNTAIVSGCDFSFSVPIWTQEQLLVAPELYRDIKPVFLGMSLELVQQLLQHPDLTQALDTIRDQGNASTVVVRHDTKEIESILAEVQKTSEHRWWEVLLGWSPNATGVLNVMLHPIVVILGLQCVILCVLIGVCIWARKRFLKLEAANQKAQIAAVLK